MEISVSVQPNSEKLFLLHVSHDTAAVLLLQYVFIYASEGLIIYRLHVNPRYRTDIGFRIIKTKGSKISITLPAEIKKLNIRKVIWQMRIESYNSENTS